LLLAGAALGGAIAFKQVEVVTAPALVAFAWSATPPARRRPRGALTDVGGLALGVLGATAASLVPIALAGVTPGEYVRGAWLILLDPGSGYPSVEPALERFVDHPVWQRSPLPVLLAGVAAFLALRRPLRRRDVPWGAIALWIALDSAGALAARTFFPHHFKPVVPAMAVATALAIAEALRALDRRLGGQHGGRPRLPREHAAARPSHPGSGATPGSGGGEPAGRTRAWHRIGHRRVAAPRRPAAPGPGFRGLPGRGLDAWLAGAARAAVVAGVVLLLLPYATLANRVTGPRRDRARVEQLEAGAWIRDRTGPDDHVFTHVGGGLVQAASGRRSPTRFFNRNFVTSDAAAQEVLRDLRARPPAVIVIERVVPAWLRPSVEECCALARRVGRDYLIFVRRP
jgi:hypothetical protein